MGRPIQIGAGGGSSGTEIGGRAWVAGLSLKAGDVVSNGGKIYLVSTDHIADSSNEPGVGPSYGSVYRAYAFNATAPAGSKTFMRFTALHNQAPASNFATLDLRNNHPCLDFDATTQEAAVFSDIIPEGVDLANGLTVCLFVALTSATTGNVGWDVAFEWLAATSGIDIDSDNFGTAQNVADTAVPATSGETKVMSVNFSLAQLPVGMGAGGRVRIRVRRRTTGVTSNASGDAELYGVEIKLQ